MNALLAMVLVAGATPSKSVVLRHATVMPASKPTIPDGAVVITNGKIAAVGPSASTPSPVGAEEIDLHGAFVTPGIIDVHSHLGVYASPSTTASDDGNEATNPVTSDVNAESSFWPQDPGLRRAVAGGVTSALILPGSANLIGGRGFPIKMRFAATASGWRFPGAKDGLKMACGENPKRVYGKKSGPSTRMGNVAGYRTAFAQAKDYAAKWDELREKQKKDPKTAGAPPPRDLKMETLADVMAGKILVDVHCYRADDMDDMLRVADEFGFQVRAFHHALEAYKIRDELVKRGVAVATWADWWGFKMEAYDGIQQNAGLVFQAGGRVAIHSDSAIGGQRLNQEAAKAMFRAREAGIQISEDDAIKWLTVNPAWILGMDEQTGSLDVGKMADVVVWNRDPFSSYARAMRTYVDGELVYDSDHGPANVSDFELGTFEQQAAMQTAKPAKVPELPRCDGNSSACAKPLEAPEAKCVAIQNATLLVDGEAHANGQVIVEGTKISRVDLTPKPVPAGCTSVDAGGRVLAPGFIDPWSALGLVEVSLEESAVDIGPKGDAAKEPVHAALEAAPSIDPHSTLFPVARGGGVTSAVVAPDTLLLEDGSPVLIAGRAAWISTDGSVTRNDAALMIRLGQGARDALGMPRGAALDRLRAVFDDARFVQKHRADIDANKSRALAAPLRELLALQPALEGKQTVLLYADRASDILGALALAKEFKLKLVIAGGAEAWEVAPELEAANVPVIVDPTQNLPSSFEQRGSRNDSAALLNAAGVKVLIGVGTDPHFERNAAQLAGNAVAWGLPHAAAMQSLTSNVADAFGLPAGKLAPGARADLVLWSGDPLDVSSHPVAMWLAGKPASLASRQDALLHKYAGK